MGVCIEDLAIDRITQTCRLKEPPAPPPRGRRSKLTPEEVRYGRYMYWSGRSAARTFAELWGLTPMNVSLIMNFKTLAWM